MKLYFFRHGLAEDPTPDKPDFKRELTKKGIQRTRASAELLPVLDVTPAHIFSSPLIRAKQTADILARALKQKVEVRDEVGPGFNPRRVEMLLAGIDDRQDVMFVGHEPDFSSTVTALIGGGSVVMKKGGLARVDVMTRVPLRGELVWLITPKLFNANDE